MDDRFEKLKTSVDASERTLTPDVNGDEAAGIDDDAGPINENLFLDEDLDGLDDELNDLDVN